MSAGLLLARSQVLVSVPAKLKITQYLVFAKALHTQVQAVLQYKDEPPAAEMIIKTGAVGRMYQSPQEPDRTNTATTASARF